MIEISTDSHGTWKDPFPLICDMQSGVTNDNYFGDLTYLYISDHFDINKSVQLFFLFLNVLTFGSLSALFIWFTSSQTQPWIFFLYFLISLFFHLSLAIEESQIHHNIYSHHFFSSSPSQPNLLIYQKHSGAAAF